MPAKQTALNDRILQALLWLSVGLLSFIGSRLYSASVEHANRLATLEEKAADAAERQTEIRDDIKEIKGDVK